MKHENILAEELVDEVEIDGHKIKTIRFDLEHINRGWDKEKHDYNEGRRSSYNSQDVVDFFEQITYFLIEWEEGLNKNKVEVRGMKQIRYYAFVYDHNNGEQKNMVIDIPRDVENEGIIVTIY